MGHLLPIDSDRANEAAAQLSQVTGESPAAAITTALGQSWGRGNHLARLNYGDWFAYALAKTSGAPDVFKGDDFARIDFAQAI